MDDFDICDDALSTSDNHQTEYTSTCVCVVLAGGCLSIEEELSA